MFQRRQKALFFILILVLQLVPAFSFALPEFSKKTNQTCNICHLGTDKGSLTSTGLEFAASGYMWPPSGGYRVLGPIKKPVRLFVGFIHIAAAFIWFGTILYVHIILKPGYASKGLPKGEVALGMASMILVGITGTLLTISRIRRFDVLYTSPWGTVLSLKIGLYLVMISTAVFIITFVGPRLRKRVPKAESPKTGVYDPVTLSSFDGKGNRPSYIAYGAEVYDVSRQKHWKGGVHMKHLAGEDLTWALKKAPHDEGKLEQLKVVGTFDAELAPPKRQIEKVFYFIAYMNLVLVFFVLFVISYWRWGL
ncbi:MAG: CopD family protein [Candidatus Hydrothermarchaeaceae archaeon]